jgi:hypothetical protein
MGMAKRASFAKGLGRIRPMLCPSQLEWFYNFLRGIKYWMGCQLQPNHGLLMGTIMYLLDLIEGDAMEAEGLDAPKAASKLWKVRAYVCVLTAASLRGHEGFYLDLTGMRKHLGKGTEGIIPPGINKNTLLSEEVYRNLSHVTRCLLGKFKGETGVDQHLITEANTTSLGLRPRWWLEKLVAVCALEVRFDGPAFLDPSRVLATSVDYDAVFRKYIGVVQDEMDFIPRDHGVDSCYSMFCTLRKMATTRIDRDQVLEITSWIR